MSARGRARSGGAASRGVPARPGGAKAQALPARPGVILFAIALGLRLLHIFAMRGSLYFDHPVIDAATYDDAARAIAAGRGHPDAIFWQPPGYSYFLAAIYAMTGPGHLAPRIVQAVLGAGSAVLTAWIGTRLFGRRVGLAAGYGFALYGTLIYFDGEILTPSLTIALQLGAVALAVGALRNPKRRDALWGAAGLVGGIASVVTATSLVLVAVLAAFARRRAPLVLLGAVVAISPVTARNFGRGGELIPISWNSGINLYIGNNPRYDETVGIRPDLQWKEFVLEPRRKGIHGAAAASNYFVGKVLHYAASDPAGFLRLQLKKVYLLVSGNEIPRNQEIYPARGQSPLLRVLLWKIPGLAFPFGVLLPVGLLGMAASWRRAPLPAAIIVAYGAAVVAFFVVARYRVPLVPYLLLFGAEGVRWLAAEPSVPKRAAALLGAGAVYLVSNLGQGGMPAKMNADAEYSLGVRLAMEERPAEAMARFESALRERPNYPEAWVNLGVLQASHGRVAEGERSLLRGLALDSTDVLALTNLAILRERAGRPAEAIAFYERAVAADSTDPFARRKLAALKAPAAAGTETPATPPK